MNKKQGKCAKKIAAAKAKIAAKCGKKAAKCAALALALGVLCVGCATSEPASRVTSATYGDITVKFGDGSNNSATITIGDGAISSSDSQGSTETTSANPTNTTDIRPDVDVNTTGGKTAGVLESAVGAGAALIKAACSDGDCSSGGCSACEYK